MLNVATKRCARCSETKPVSEFRRWRRKRPNGEIAMARRSYCIPCEGIMQRERWHKDPEKSREMRRRYQQRPQRKLTKRRADLKAYHGITPEQYDLLLAEQGGVCAICGAATPDGVGRQKHFHIDHCHQTGTIRGLLCGTCNAGVGRFHDDPSRLERAAAYLRRSPPIEAVAPRSRPWD